MILRVCGAETDLVDVPSGLRDRLVEQSRGFDGSALVYMITVLEELRRSVKSSGSSRALVEAAAIRLADASNFSAIESLLARVQPNGSAPASPRPASRSASVSGAKKNEAPRVVNAPGPAVSGSPPIAPAPAAPTAPAAAPMQPARAIPMPSPNPPRRRTTQEDVKIAQSKPVVRAALDLFGGKIVEVDRVKESVSETTESTEPV